MPNKALGQHWLKDELILEAIIDCADVKAEDTVLEIGPGLGTLTRALLARAKEVVAVEYDQKLAGQLVTDFAGEALTLHNQDILQFNFRTLPEKYVVVANIPYYITSKIVHVLSTCINPPRQIVLLVQKEVAERLAAEPGDLSISALSAQIFHEVSLGPVVGAEWFTPPPKVDSQVVIMNRRAVPLVSETDQAAFFRIVKAGFGERRKKLRSSLAGGLGIDKTKVDDLLSRTGLPADARAQELSIDDWKQLAKVAL